MSGGGLHLAGMTAHSNDVLEVFRDKSASLHAMAERRANKPGTVGPQISGLFGVLTARIMGCCGLGGFVATCSVELDKAKTKGLCAIDVMCCMLHAQGAICGLATSSSSTVGAAALLSPTAMWLAQATP